MCSTLHPRFGMINAMKRTLLTAATSSWLIFLVALLARLGFAWYMERQIPRDVLAPASFAQETGSIAQALATGRGFSSPFGKDTGPTAWLTPVYPLLVQESSASSEFSHARHFLQWSS